MPSKRPCAAFEPISPDLNVTALVESTPNFEYVVRIHCDMIDHQGIEAFEKLILLHVIIGGKPLVIEGYQQRLDRWTFALQWLRDNCAQKVENARDLTKKANLPLSIGHYLNNMALLTNQWTSSNYKDPERQRIYLKDIDCPPLWHHKLSQLIPSALFYLNDSTGEPGGPGSTNEPNINGPGIRRGHGIAQAGDLMSNLPLEMRAENMMCYIGHEGTYTPAHREMCASLGQNIMVETSTGLVEDGKPTRPGSSVWFMTESKDRYVVSEYWLSALGHDIEVENHFAQINAWKAAPFKTYVVEQRVGDFILIPPLAPHQVWNRGTRTMKAAWNRTTVETLEMALDEALPRARMVCRDEQYKNKAIVYYTLVKYSKLLNAAADLKQKSSGKPPAKIRQLQKDFRRLHSLYTRILVSESFTPGQEERKVDYTPYDSNITCSYCRGNIFNRFLTCPSCVGKLPNEEDDTYDVCIECYAMGRSCQCISKLKWVEQFSWGDLTQKHEQWRRQIIQSEGQVTEKAPKSLKVELDRYGRRTLAGICQLELKKRPWKDVKKPTKPDDTGNESEDVEVNGEGIVRKKRRKPRLSEKFKKEHKVCHFHTTWEPTWKQAQCSRCEVSLCFGLLARAFDMKPQDILAETDWKCPKCRNFCICRRCRDKPGWKMIEPPRIMLGHDTKKVADPRSVESLVDYSQSNISWLQKVGDDGSKDTRRLQKRQRAAEKAKAQAPVLSENYIQDTAVTDRPDDGVENQLLRLAQHEGIPIDPTLECGAAVVIREAELPDEDEGYDENPEEAGVDDQYAPYYPGPPQPQHIIPAGGIIRNAERAYDATEAITFDYPDPEVELQVPVSQGEEPPREPTIPGYEPVVLPDSPGEIEMVPRKRKRAGVDPGYAPSQKSPKRGGVCSNQRKKPRKSLVVKFNLNHSKLAEFNRTVVNAQRARNGVEGAETPVIGSDLRALNVESGAAAKLQHPAKKARFEPEDADDDFTGPRIRKGRQNSTTESHPVPARRTRTQTLAYDGPSDVEEVEQSWSDRSDEPTRQISANQRNNPKATGPRPAGFHTDGVDEASSADPDAEQDRTPQSHFSSSGSEAAVSGPGRRVSSAAKLRPGSSNRMIPPQHGAQLSEADKNRKAKLAALNWAASNSDDNLEGDHWSGSTDIS